MRRAPPASAQAPGSLESRPQRYKNRAVASTALNLDPLEQAPGLAGPAAVAPAAGARGEVIVFHPLVQYDVRRFQLPPVHEQLGQQALVLQRRRHPDQLLTRR